MMGRKEVSLMLSCMLERLERRRLLSGHSHLPRTGKHPAAPPAVHLAAKHKTVGAPATFPTVGTGAVAAPHSGQTFVAVMGSFNGSVAHGLTEALNKFPNLETFVTVAWGDGTSSQGVLQVGESGDLDVLANHKYAAP